MEPWPKWVWFMMGGTALWILWRIYEVVKSIHFMIRDDFKRKHPEVDWREK